MMILGALTGLLLLMSPLDSEDSSGTAPAAATPSATVRVNTVRLEGNRRTRADTFLELLPRRPPAVYRETELRELERRINNLGVFDSVATHVEHDELVITVREKFTLTPSLDFSTGESLKDIEGAIGATEYNFLGRASELGLVVGREQRGPTAWVWFAEHALRPGRGAFVVGAGFERASLRFGPDPDRPAASWYRDRGGIEIGYRTPYAYGRFPLRYEVGAFYARELVQPVIGAAAPPDGHAFGTSMTFTFDRYTWRDLVPEGFRVKAIVRPGWYLPEGKSRFSTQLTAVTGIPLGKLTVLTARSTYELVAAGNPNHNVLIGSQDGVRGLRDAYYRNRQLAYANVELRHAIKLAERWALQGVAFVDGGVFEPMDARGVATRWQGAVSAGAGLRIIPTFLTQLLVRADVARLFIPEEQWFLQLGVTQYF